MTQLQGNKNTILICGRPCTGKSVSLQGITNQKEYVYFNTELKELPFKQEFMKVVQVIDPKQLLDWLDEIEKVDAIKGVIIDSLTFLMTSFVTKYINAKPINSEGKIDVRTAWGDYAHFYKCLMEKIKASNKTFIITAHVNEASFDATTNRDSVSVAVQGSVQKIGVEADFTLIIFSRVVKLMDLMDKKNNLLHVTEHEEEDNQKYVFLTRPYYNLFVGDTPRSPLGFWKRTKDEDELFIDNNIQSVIDRCKEYYQ